MKRAMRRRKTWQRQAAAITAAMMAMSVGGIAYAMPQGEVIRSGKGEITRQDKDMTVNQDSKRLAIDWSGFDIANDERVTFRQPDKDSVALNRVVGDAASVIDGTLSGNGHVYVINPNGVLFGKNASVDVGSLVASTARISDSDMTNFANADGITMAIPEDSSAKVINAGTIRAEGGLVVLHAAEVENSGTITNPEGTTALAAARNLSLSADTAGKINFTVDGALAKAKALNSGMLKADGGYLVMTARSAGDVMSTVVNNTGTMEAKTLRQNEKGEILLDGGDNGIVELNGTLDVSGMEAGQSAGSIKAIGAETHVEDGATLHAIGAVDGGLIETSGDYLEIGDNVDIDAAGKTGKAGEWLLDPLEVVISDSKPSGSSSVTNGDTDGSYNSSNDASGTASRNKTTWVNSNTVNTLLNNGTAVSVQATDANKVASITLDSAINKTSGADTSLTLEAQRNVTVNAGITSSSGAGALDVNLHSDTDGDGLGAVLINADIATNGGAFTSGSGTTIESGSVGTYFGNQGEMGDRHVTTNGGAINLYGDVAIGLNGGTLTLDTQKGNSASGAVTVTGTVDSGNSYKRVASGLDGWTDFVKSYYDEVLRTVPTYTLKSGAKKSSASASSPRYILYSDGTVSRITSGRGYKESDLQATGETITLSSYDELSASQKSNLSSYLAAQSITWAGAKAMAQGATKGTNHTGDTYLATITTALENSLASPPEEYQLIVGGRGSGDATRLNPNPADPDHPDGYYWVTGPEGMANNGKGTKFAKNDGSAVDNYYVKWNYSYSQDTKQTEKEPNNSGPIVSIGFGTESKWDDVLETAGTIRGFVQEKNLEHSGLVINAGDSKVDIAGNIGNSVALKNVEINAGDVAIGSGSHYTGIVHTDEGVSITGKNVTVGDRITADTKGVDIQATGNIDVDGITAHENINLTTTDGSIVLNKDYNDGSLNTDSQDNDAVVIDVQDKNGSFQNLTSTESAITTGEGGNWKVYSYSPDADTFGTNLNSGINAQWGATSTSYSASEHDGDKYIFQVKPTVYVTAKDMKKVYGEVLTNDNVTTTAEATFTGQDNKEHKVNAYTDAFTEGDVSDYYNGSGTFTSEGWAKTATRTGGDKAPASEPENNAIYNIKATSDSYNLTDLGKTSGYADATTKDGGTVEILRRQINVNGSGSQTYGNATINDWKLTASLTGNQEGVPSGADAIVNDDKLDESTGNLSIKSDSSYAENQAGRTTADANPNSYEDAVNMENIGFENGAGVNYEIVKAQGDLKVNKASLSITSKSFTETYGDVAAVQKDLEGAVTITGLTNGDNNGESTITVDGTSDALITENGETRTNDVKQNGNDGYDINASIPDNLTNTINKNYEITDNLGEVVLQKRTAYLSTDDIHTVYGDGDTIYNKLAENNLLHLTNLASWDAESTILKEIKAETSVKDNVSAFKLNADGTIAKDSDGHRYTNDVRSYSITTSWYRTLAKNYTVEKVANENGSSGNIYVDPADLIVYRKGIDTVYGTVKKDPGDMTTYTTLVNGDTNDIVIDNGNYGTAYNDDLTKTNNVGKYDYKATLNSDSDVLRNYNVHDDGTNYVNITPLNITEDNVNDFITNATYTTVYGSKADFGQAVFTGVNGDGTRDLSITGSSALTGNTEGVITKDAAENAYNTVVSLDGLSAQDKKNYGLEDTSSFTFDNSATVEKADLTVSRKGIDTVYGTVKKDPGDMTTYTTLVNGDTNDIVIDNGNYGTAYNDDLTKTNNVGKYDYKATLNSDSDVLRNYNVHDDGTNYVNITPYTITEQEVVNLDGSPLYTTKYGQKDAFGTATFTGVNGDGTYELAITDSSALATAGAGKVTQDVGKNIYDTTVKLSEAMNGNYQFADGATSKTFEKTASVTPAELTIKTKDVETEYGTVKMTTSEVDGLRNGDLPTGFIYDYGNYGGAYLDGNTKTNDVNTYHFGTMLSGAEFLKNYTITGGEADVKIDPKDVTFFVSGTGNTLTDVTYTVDPDIDAQLAYGEHVDADYTPGNDLGSNQYGVVAHINGTPIVTGDVAGNYRYNYGGLITLSSTVPTKPDIDPHNPSNLDGSGSWTSNMGNHGVPGVERVAGLASAELPFFKVEAGQVSHYGTYDVAADPDKVRLEPTGKRLPEPNQPKTQYREYTKALTTTDGTGMFRMVYDGSTFNITPVDDGALALMRMGDVKNNVELSAEALHAGFSEMGILLEDLDGVYVHFDTMA